MAFGAVVVGKTVFGNKRVHFGTYGSSTGGDVDTGLRRCEHMILGCKGSAVQGNAPVVDESMPCAGNAVSIVHDSGAVGYWLAIGN
jgi:hypothetical protein